MSRKSRATRAGFATANPAGGLAGGAFSVKRTIVRPDAPLETLSESIELVVCAPVGPAAASASATSSHARRADGARPGRGAFNPNERTHFLRSCVFDESAWINCSVLERSVQSPALSCTSSFKRISLSLIEVTTP